jgi:hypothetical protein
MSSSSHPVTLRSSWSRGVARLLAFVALVVVVPATPAAAGRKPASTAWVVLVHTTGDAPTTWVEPLQKAAQGAAADRKWVAPPTTAFDELQIALGCADWDATCASLIAASVGAGNAVVVTVGNDGGVVVVDSSVVGAGGALLAAGERLTLAAKTDADLHAVERWVAGIVRGVRPAVLVVASELAGDEVLLDGALVGQTPATIVDVAPGPHALQVRRAGRAPVQRVITIAAGTTARAEVALGAVAPTTTSTPTIGSDAATATALSSSTAWGLAGVGGLTAVVGGVLAAVNGLPVLEMQLNQTDGKLNRSYQPLLFGDPVVGKDRFAFLAARFATDASKVQDRNQFAVIVERATTLANVGLVLVAAGGVLSATGIGLGAGGGDEPPAATTPAATTPAATTPATTTPTTTTP